jgi:chitin disaccharide deacetylase
MRTPTSTCTCTPRSGAIRVPREPAEPLARCGQGVSTGDRVLARWSGLLRWQARRAQLRVNDNVFGLAWSGHMTPERIQSLLPHLPAGLTEIYFHPADARDPALTALMPDYEHEAELAALLDPGVRSGLSGVELTTYGAAS